MLLAELGVYATTELRRAIALSRDPVFIVRGLLEDEQVEARWVPGLGLICPRQLRQRAQVIVAMGDTFDATPEGPVRTATLDGARGALPTIARAFSRIEFVQIAVR